MMKHNRIVQLESKDQYELLGFLHDTSKLLFVEDYSKEVGCPKHKPSAKFLWNDISLSKDSTFPERNIELENEKFILKRGRCGGVKVAYLHI